MAAFNRMIKLTEGLKNLTSSHGYRFQASKTFYTYVNEPAMPIPDKEPCWVKTSEEAVERAGLASGKLIIYLKKNKTLIIDSQSYFLKIVRI